MTKSLDVCKIIEITEIKIIIEISFESKLSNFLLEVVSREQAFGSPENCSRQYLCGGSHEQCQLSSLPQDGVLVGIVGTVLARYLQDGGHWRRVGVQNMTDLRGQIFRN